MNWQSPASIQIVISDLNEIAADAYRHRIRPTLKKGGNGVYDKSNGGFSYNLPQKYSSNRRARFDVIGLSADEIHLRATSLDDPSSSIKASIDDRGSLRNIVVEHGTEARRSTAVISSSSPAPTLRPKVAGSPVLFYGEE